MTIVTHFQFDHNVYLKRDQNPVISSVNRFRAADFQQADYFCRLSAQQILHRFGAL